MDVGFQRRRTARIQPTWNTLGRVTSYRNSSRICNKQRPLRAGFTVLELLTVIGIISTIMSILLPAIGSAREAARRMQCTNQLKQIGLALHNYHETNRCFPAGWQWEASKQSGYGWAVPLLPYLEHQSVYAKVDRNRLIGDAENGTARATQVSLYHCPSDIISEFFPLFEKSDGTMMAPLVQLPTASYVGVFGTVEADEHENLSLGNGAFVESRCVRIAEFQRGLSHTIIVGERTMARVPSTWLGVDFRGEDALCRLTGSAVTSPNCKLCDECEFDSRHPGGANFLWGDGSVQLISSNINSTEYRRLSRISGF